MQQMQQMMHQMTVQPPSEICRYYIRGNCTNPGCTYGHVFVPGHPIHNLGAAIKHMMGLGHTESSVLKNVKNLLGIDDDDGHRSGRPRRLDDDDDDGPRRGASPGRPRRASPGRRRRASPGRPRRRGASPGRGRRRDPSPGRPRRDPSPIRRAGKIPCDDKKGCSKPNCEKEHECPFFHSESGCLKDAKDCDFRHTPAE